MAGKLLINCGANEQISIMWHNDTDDLPMAPGKHPIDKTGAKGTMSIISAVGGLVEPGQLDITASATLSASRSCASSGRRRYAAGVAARPGAGGWLVLPADMPLVQPSTLITVAAAIGSQPVSYAQYQGRRGHPVAFGAELFSELVRLSGEEGARRILARFPGQAVESGRLYYCTSVGAFKDYTVKLDDESRKAAAIIATDIAESIPPSASLFRFARTVMRTFFLRRSSRIS